MPSRGLLTLNIGTRHAECEAKNLEEREPYSVHSLSSSLGLGHGTGERLVRRRQP